MDCVTSTHPVKATIPEQPARQLDQPEVVAIFLVVADEDAAALRQPGEGPLHHPTTWLVTLRSVARLPLLADPSDVRDIAVALGQQALLGPLLATIGGVLARLFPPRTGPCPASRRRSATPTSPRRVRR